MIFLKWGLIYKNLQLFAITDLPEIISEPIAVFFKHLFLQKNWKNGCRIGAMDPYWTGSKKDGL